MLEITSSKNPLIKEVKGLYRKKERLKNKSFIVEGIKMIEEALDNGYSLKSIIFTDQLLKNKDGKEFYHRIQELNNLIYVPMDIFKEICDTENPQGVLAIARFPYQESIDMKNDYKDKIIIYLDEVQDPGNMGTIIRTADAFNVDGIIIGVGSVDPYNSKVVRATMGSIFRVPLYYSINGVEDLKYMKSKGVKIYSTSLEESIPIYDLNMKEGIAIVIGNESKGVSKEVLELSDKKIKIPMPGGAESLNAGVAASIIMYEAIKQKLNIS